MKTAAPTLTQGFPPAPPALRVNKDPSADPLRALSLNGWDATRADGVANVCVGIATRGRPEVLAGVLGRLREQTLRPTSIVVACTRPEDVGDIAVLLPEVTVLTEEPGLTRQRNRILRSLPPSTDIVVFFDDDFLPRPEWLAAVVQAFRDHPQVGCVTGHVVVDGIKGPGLSVEDASRALQADDATGADVIEENYSPYGCNMALRRSAIGHLCFDERLVLYGWLEDRDFGGAMALNGWRLLKVGAARGAHLGIKKGRVAGRKLGYSQVMNPVYLTRKGTISLSVMAEHVGRNILANLVRSFAPESFVDRRGRLRGNGIAILDLLRGRLTPERAERL